MGELRLGPQPPHLEILRRASLLRMTVLLLVLFALVLLRLVVERLVGDPEDVGGLLAVAVGHVEGLFDDDALDLFHGRAQRQSDAGARAAPAVADQLVWQALDRESVGS